MTCTTPDPDPLLDERSKERVQDQCSCKVPTVDGTDPRENKQREIIWAGLSKEKVGPDATLEQGFLTPEDIRREDSFELDAHSNWTRHTRDISSPTGGGLSTRLFDRVRSINDADQVTSVTDPTTSPTYDSRGNLRDDGHLLYLYDVFNRLTRVYYRDTNGNADGEYAHFHYDALGQRVSAVYDLDGDHSTDNDPADLFAYDDQWRVVAVLRYQPETSTSVEFTWVRERYAYHATGESMGAAGHDTPIARIVDEDGDGTFERQDYFLANRHGDTVFIVGPGHDGNNDGDVTGGDAEGDSYGTVRARIYYTAYGEPIISHPLDLNRDGVIGGSAITDDAEVLANIIIRANDPNSTWIAPWHSAGDLNKDGLVDAADIAYLYAHSGSSEHVIANDFGSIPLYAGYWWDPHLSKYHVRHRIYDPFAARWLQRDPAGLLGGVNLYGYVGAMPWLYVDPMGLFFGQNGLLMAMCPGCAFIQGMHHVYTNGIAAANNIAAVEGREATTSEKIIAIAGEATGVNNAVAGSVGYDARTNTIQTEEERVSKGLIGYAQMVLFVVAPLAGAEAEVGTAAAEADLVAEESGATAAESSAAADDGVISASEEAEQEAAARAGDRLDARDAAVEEEDAAGSSATDYESGSYTNYHKSGMRYHGKGEQERAAASGKRILREYDDPLERTDRTPARSQREAFKQEHKRLQADGGPENPMNYNKINSPGKTYCRAYP